MNRRLRHAVGFAPITAVLFAICAALAIALSPLIAPAHAQVVADFPRVTYTSTSATLTGNPVTLDSPSVLSTSSVVTSASLGFSFNFFGRTYSTVAISLNGNLQFATMSAASTPLAFPTGAQSVLPVLAFAWTSLAPNASSSLAYKTIGVSPSRQFVVRFSNVPLASAASSAMLSVDVILSEGTNTIQLAYYSFPSTTQVATVGMSSAFHDDWTTEWLVLSGLNVAAVSVTTAAALNGRIFTITPTASLPYTSQSATPAPVASGRYYATIAPSSSASPGALSGAVSLAGTNDAITAINIGFSFFFYGTWYVALNVGANGEVQFATSSTSSLTSTMPTGNTGIRPFIAIAYSNWNPSVTGSRTYALSGSPGLYQFTLRYTNVPHNDLPTARLSADLVLFQSDYHFEVRYYLIDPILTPVVIGAQAAEQLSPTVYDYVSVWNNLPMTATASAFLVGKTISYSYANGTITPPAAIPRSYTSTLLSSVRTLQPLVNASFLNGGNDIVDTVNIGFAFWFYGAYYSRVQITCNGDLQFKTSAGAYTQLAMPSMSIARNPYLAYFYTDLAPLANAARSFSLVGSYPNRVFTLRLDSVPYASSMYNSPAPSVTIDVQLFERNASIAVSYYSVAASAQNVLIGVEGSGVMRIDNSFDFTDVLNNVTMGAAAVSSLSGSTLWLTPRNFSGPPPFVPAQTYRWTRTGPAPPRTALTGSVYLRPSDDILYIFNIGFTFTFFGLNYTTVVFSSNGNLQFGPSYSSAWAPQPMPTGNAALAPFVAALFSDMVGFAPHASSEYARLGTAPNRSLLIRMDNYGYRFDSETPALTVDYVLFEGSNKIEIRYYLVTGSVPRSNDAPQNVLVGIQGSVTPRVDNSYDATIVWNAVDLPDAQAAQWNNTVLTFELADPNAPIVAALPDTYTVNVTRGATQVALSNPTILTLGDNAIQQVAIGFQFSFYGELYSTVYISSNGNLQFLSSSASAVPVAMPSVGAGTPVIAFFFTDLVPTTSSISYATVGSTYPTRTFVVRYANVPYARNASAALSCDVVLFELDGRIEIRYFRADPTPTQNVLIGVQDVPVQRADWSYDFTAFINLMQIQPTVVSQLVGNTVTFLYTTPIAAPPALTPLPCTQQGTYMCTHSLSVVPPVDMTGASISPFSPFDADDEVDAISIGFPFRFFNRYYTAVNISSNGNLQFSTNDPQWDSESLPNGNGPLAPFLAFGFADLYADPGTRSYKTFGTTTGTRYFVLRYNRVWFIRSPQTITVDVVLFETGTIELRYYQVGTTLLPTLIGVSDVLPPGGSDFDYAVLLNSRDITNELSSRLSGSTVTFSRVSQPSSPLPKTYSISLLTSTLPTRTTPAEMRSLPGSNDNLDVVQIGFPFSFYGQYYTSLSISSNGDLQFRTANAVFYSAPLPWDDFGRTPFLAFFYTDLYPIANTARSYLRSGSAPSRQFLLRYSDVPYASTAAQATPLTVAIDVVLMEAGHVIEVRYYRVDQSAQPVTIGAQNFARLRADGEFDYTVYWNSAAVSASSASALQGKALRFTPLTVPSNAPRVPYPSYSMRRNFTVPPKIALSAPGSLPGSGGNTWVYVPLGFSFPFYGSTYTWCNINQNGYIMFASLALVQMPEKMPYGNYGMLPIIAPYFSDLTSASGYGLWLYQTLGTAPSRYFVLRMDGIQYSWNSNVQTISVDTLLYETSGRIEVRIYAAGRSEGQSQVLIGVQGPPSTAANDGTYDYTVLVNCEYLSEADAIDLASTSVVFDPVPSGGLLPTSPVPPTYNSTLQSGVPTRITLVSPNVLSLADDALTAVPIGFAVSLFGHFYSGFRLNSNGLLQFVTSNLAISPEAIPYGNSRALPFIAVLFTDLAPSTTSSIVYETIGQAPNRTFVLRLADVPYKLTRASSPPPCVSLDFLIFESSGVMETRFYRVDPTDQNVLVGLQGSRIIRDDWTQDFVVVHNAVPLTTALAQRLNQATLRYTLAVSSATPATPSVTPPTLTPLTVQSRGSYTGVHVLDVPPRAVLPSPRTVSSVSDVNMARTLPIGFSFVFYGQTYTTVNVSSNGNLQFARTAASVVSDPTTMPDGNAALRPFIAFFLTSMAPSAVARTYQTIGMQPNRQFVLQLTSVGFVTTLTAIDLDVVLFETSNRIELRYYSVPSYPSRVLIGVQSGQDWADYSVVHNNEVVSDLRSLQLTGSLVVFTPTSSIDPSVLTATCATALPLTWSASAYPVQFTLEFATTIQQLATVWASSFVSTVLGTIASSLSISPNLLACSSLADVLVQVPVGVNTTAPLNVVRFKFYMAGDASSSRSAVKLSTALAAYVLDRSSALYVQLPSDFSNLLRPSNLSTSVLCNSLGTWVDPSQCADLTVSNGGGGASEGSSSGLSAGAAAGIAIGVVVGVLIVVALAYRVFRRSDKGSYMGWKSRSPPSTDIEASQVSTQDASEEDDASSIEMSSRA